MMSKWKPILAVVGNSSIVILLVAITLALRKGIIGNVTKVGFFCGDPSIQYPIKKESISTSVLLMVGVISALVLTLLTEFLRVKRSPQKQSVCGLSLPKWVIRGLIGFGMFLFGLCVTALIVDLGKVSSGVLRPNFLAMCQPNVTCANEDPHTFQTSYQCTASQDGTCPDCSKSFPSGHAAVVAFMAFYISLFLQTRPEAFHLCYLLRPLVQIISFCLAWWTSLTRISDHVHHVSDVVVGFALGIVVAVWSCRFVTEWDQLDSTGLSHEHLALQDDINLKTKDTVVHNHNSLSGGGDSNETKPV